MLLCSACSSSRTNAILASHLTGANWQIVAVDPDDGVMRQLTRTPTDKRMPVVSTDPSSVIYRSNEGDLCRINIRGGVARQFISGDQITSFDVRANLIAVSRIRGAPLSNTDVWLGKQDRPDRCVLDEVAREEDVAISPDGSKLAYSRRMPGEPQDLWLYDVTTGKRTQLTSGQRWTLCACWSPDGTRLAYASNTFGDFEIFVVEIGTGKMIRLTNDAGFDSFPAWSPDGQCIAFVSNRSGALRIWLMNADGSGQRCLTADESEFRELSWR